jgi:hypothetical protein
MVILVIALVLIGILTFAGIVAAGHDDDPRTVNLHPMGHIEEPASLFYGPPTIHTDIAFWGKHAFQGNWLGINIRDISAPGNPKNVSFTECTGNQGDVVVWDNILVRSWNSPAPAGATCDGEAVAEGFEGLHIFDISDLNDPTLIGEVELECGSHTATGVPDPDNGRLLIYNSGSSNLCEGMEIVEIPLDNPAAAAEINFVALDRDCHDIAVILGDAMRAACAGDDGYAMLDLSTSLDNPSTIYERGMDEFGVTIGHTGSFSWDGEVFVFGHEPGGGVAPRCQESDPDDNKSAFFLDTETGDYLGQWVLPRPQSATENCTIHNLNTVPNRNGRNILISGNYQSGTSVVDFTDPANPVELAYSDPPAIDPIDLGGAWSSYWYNNFIYETNITEGLNIFRFSDNVTGGAMRLDHLNPQTQMFTIP